MRLLLSKSRFTTGVQCEKLLWWTVHEPDAPELTVDAVLRDRFDQGLYVGRLARERFPGGVLIDRDLPLAERAAATRAAIDGRPPAIFEAACIDGGLYVAVDVLERRAEGWSLVEVKSSTRRKDEHLPDVAVQLHVLRGAGVPVARAELMHLNAEFRLPDHGDLFARTDVTDEVESFLPEVPRLAEAFAAALAGDLPAVAVGLHCWQPRECPLFDRCWPGDRDHIRRLYRAWKTQTVARMQKGIHSLHDLPGHEKLSDIQTRQLRAVREDRVIVEPALADALAAFRVPRLGFLDFETVNRAVPVWTGLGPWNQAVCQFSYHERDADGAFIHDAYLAEGPHDPRPELVDRMLAATRRADAIVMYSSFERSRINELALQVPDRGAELQNLAAKLVDLLPIIQQHVYHPEFRGSFSLKRVLPALVPTLTYDDLVIVDGMMASVQIARLLFLEHLVEDRDRTRADLLAYCERDTWAMVELLRRLEALAGMPPAAAPAASSPEQLDLGLA